MDELLKRRPSQLTDERKEMFALLDRFFGAIQAYRKQYESIVDKKNADIQQRNSNKQDTLRKISETQRRELEQAKSELTNRVSDLNKQISMTQNQAAQVAHNEESKLAEQEKNEKTILNQAHMDDETDLNKYRNIRRQIDEILQELDEFLGTTFLGDRKLENMSQSMTYKKNVTSKKEALESVSPERVEEARMLYKEVYDITLSLSMKIFFGGRKNKYISRMLEIEELATSAVAFLENECKKDEQERRSKSDSKCRNLREECNRRKKQIFARRDENIKKLQEEIVKAQKKYSDTTARVMQNSKNQAETQEKHHTTQILNAQKMWMEEQKKCNERFVAMMEEMFPPANMNAWMRQFWLHPRSVEAYSKIHSLQLNVLIGMASVDISSWLQGDTGNVIKKVLTKYILLFGTNKEQAIKAYHEAKLNLPYTISIEEGISIHISYDDASDEKAKIILNAVGMRLLRSVPACMMRFQLFDANGIGAFGRLMSLDPAIGNNPSEPIVKSFAIGEGGKVHSNSSDIAKQIAETKITMDDLSRQLTNYQSIREFNESNPLSKQIYRPILMMNFPLGLDEKEVQTLNAMASDCSKWGFSMILAQPDKAVKSIKPEFMEKINELRKNVLCMRMESSVSSLKVLNSTSIVEKAARIFMYGLPDSKATDAIAAEIREQSVEASRVLIKFSEAKGICPDKNLWYQQKADDGVVIPVGYLEGGQPFKLQFDDKHVHTIVMGNTGSGKTNLLHVLMTNMMLRYAPEEVMIYLIDFKYGLDFRIYTQYNLPNFKTISINNDPEFALAMLQNLEKEQEERSNRMGSKYQKISEYNAANPHDRMNRIILVVDELYELAKRATDDVQKSILQKIDSFAHQTRAFGIHMIVSGQDLDKIENFDTIKNQCTTRLALHCGDEQVKMLMSDDGVARMHTIDATDQGACVFSLSGGANPQIEHTTYLGSDQQAMFLKEIHKHYMDKKQITNVKVLLTKVSDNPNHAIQMFVNSGFIPNVVNSKLLIGEPITMERELHIQPSENVWVAGGSTSEEALDAGSSLMFFSVLSLMLAKLKNNNLDIVCTNCCDEPMRSIDDEEKDYFGHLTSGFPALFKYSTGENFKEVLRVLLDELDARRSNSSSNRKAIWWFVVRPEMMNGLSDDGNFIIDMKELLQNGPKYNIHVVIWNSDLKQAQKLQFDKSLFKERICLEMTPEESKIVNGAELKPMPNGYKAIVIGNNTMRFRIYDLPDGKWMNMLFERLNKIITKK